MNTHVRDSKKNPEVEKTSEAEMCVHTNGAGGSEGGLGQQVAWLDVPCPPERTLASRRQKTHEYTHFKTNTWNP